MALWFDTAHRYQIVAEVSRPLPVLFVHAHILEPFFETQDGEVLRLPWSLKSNCLA